MSKIVSLQLLRGLAATTVAGFHLYAASVENGHDPRLFKIFAGGEIGVDIFFVISGFIILYASQGRANLSAQRFLKARFWRIIPPYWVILTLYILAVLAQSMIAADPTGSLTWSAILVSYALLPYPDHIIIIAWTLTLELLFYGVFALTFFNGGLRRLISALVLWVIISQVALHFVQDVPIWLQIPLHSAVLEFLFGTLIAVLFTLKPEVIRRFRFPAIVLGGTSVAAYLVGYHVDTAPWGREISAGIPAAFLVFGTLGFSLKPMPALETWGESSYILYLVHLLCFATFGSIAKIALNIDVYASQAWMLIMLIGVIAISYGATVWLEKPYQRWYRRFLR